MTPEQDQLFREILQARQRVYAFGHPTPLEQIPLPVAGTVFLKREDLSPVNAYKWRGAANRMAVLTPEEQLRGAICASAGNHAQGVALAARMLGISAQIYMPRSTPKMKQLAVARHGGENVEIVLHGDTYDAASQAARVACEATGRVFIHPYDDYLTMGGQGTLADEVVMSGEGPFDVAYLQIGGGGMAAAVACWLRYYYPKIRLVAVEGVDQACMKAAIEAGKPVALDYVDVFSDGTAVKKAGDLTYPLCAQLFDEFITVTNDEICAAIQLLWEGRRIIPEPAGALGLAGLMKQRDLIGKDQRALVILCGANMDFSQLGNIARRAGIGAARRRYYRFQIPERPGTFLRLIEEHMEGLSISDFQYGKCHHDLAWPVIGFDASAPELDLLGRRLREANMPFDDVTTAEDADFRLIHYEPGMIREPIFITLEFPERAGALRDFLRRIAGLANVCYFNYSYSGERVGRALMGFEVTNVSHEAFVAALKETGLPYREVGKDVLKRILS